MRSIGRLLALALFFFPSISNSQVAPQWIDQELGDELKQPLARFFERWSANADKAREAVERSRMRKLYAYGRPGVDTIADTHIIHVDNNYFCLPHGGGCLTLVGRIERGEWVASAQVMTGNCLAFSDVIGSIGDFRMTTIFFPEPIPGITLFSTSTGWVVIPGAQLIISDGCRRDELLSARPDHPGSSPEPKRPETVLEMLEEIERRSQKP